MLITFLNHKDIIMIKGISGLLFQPKQASANIPKEVQEHLDRAQYFLGFTDPKEKKHPGLIGMIAFDQQIKGLETEQFYFQNALQRPDFNVDVKLAISKMLNKVEHALDKLHSFGN